MFSRLGSGEWKGQEGGQESWVIYHLPAGWSEDSILTVLSEVLSLTLSANILKVLLKGVSQADRNSSLSEAAEWGPPCCCN